MNKVAGDLMKERSLRSDYDFLTKLDKANNSIENKIWNKFCSKNLDLEMNESQRFISHPRRIASDSDGSNSKSPGNSPRFFTLLPRSSETKCLYTQSQETGKCYSKRLKNKLTKLFLEDVAEFQNNAGDGLQNLPVYEESPEKSKCRITEDTYGTESELNNNSQVANGKKQLKKKSNAKKSNNNNNNTNINNKRSAPLKSVLKNRNDISNVSFDTYRPPSLIRKRTSKSAGHAQLHSERSDMSTGLFNTKVKIAIQKCLSYIKDISAFIEKGVVVPDGQEDYLRRMKRVQEFSNRFSRNYLYPLARQLNDMDIPKATNMNQKIHSSYQIIQQALQMYLNHLPSSAGNCASDKLKILLGHALHLCEIHQSLGRNENDFYIDKEYLDVLKNYITLLTEDIEYNFENKMIPEKTNRECKKASLSDMKENKSNNVLTVTNKKKKKLKNPKLSMYNSNFVATYRKDPPWRRMADIVCKKKYNVKSRYKTATYKHRPPVEKLPIPEEPPKNSMLLLNQKRSSNTIVKTPVVTPINEDEIETMIQKDKMNNDSEEIVPETVSLEGSQKQQFESASTTHREDASEDIQQDAIQKLLQLVKSAQKQADSGESPLQTDVYNDLTQTVDFLQSCLASPSKKNQEMFNNLISKLGLGDDEKWTKLNTITTSTRYIEKSNHKLRKQPSITVTGAKNAKLFCIVDNNEIYTEENETHHRDVQEQDNGNQMMISSTTQTDLNEIIKNPIVQKSKISIKISRLPKHSRKQLDLLPKEYAIKVIQYKMDFQNHCKGNRMYDKQSAIVPWLLTGKISDNLLEYALAAVTNEIEVGGILETLYRAEFQC